MVQRGEYWGYFDNDLASVTIISREKSEAITELKRLLRPEKKLYRKGLDEVAEELAKKAKAA